MGRSDAVATGCPVPGCTAEALAGRRFADRGGCGRGRVSEARARNQIERYMVWPAQALSYKIGSLKMLELRARAQKELGDKFSYPKFHEMLIGGGTLSLPILEQRVVRWIAASK